MAVSALALLPSCGNDDEAALDQAFAEADQGPAFELWIEDAGFATPESVLHDPVADVYLVANINGSSLDEDGNGFISRISPAGEVQELKWIDGEAGVILNAPKGMAILADTLFVADIDCLRRFHRVTGEELIPLCMDEAGFLNDIAVTAQGDLFFTDSGTDSAPGAVYRKRRTADVPQLVTLADGTELVGDAVGSPNGIFADERGIFVATFGSGEVFRVTPEGERLQLLPPSELQLDGFVSLEEWGFLFSSWGDQAVYWVTPGGDILTLVEGVEAPADLGFDAGRNRALIPLFHSNRILIREVK
jgi:hypothetical protein